MATLVQGSDGSMWIENGNGNSCVGQIKPVAYQIVNGDGKCIGALIKHGDDPWEFNTSIGVVDNNKDNLSHQDIQIVERMMDVLNKIETSS